MIEGAGGCVQLVPPLADATAETLMTSAGCAAEKLAGGHGPPAGRADAERGAAPPTRLPWRAWESPADDREAVRAAVLALDAAASAVRRLQELRDAPASADLLAGVETWPSAVVEADRREALEAARVPHVRALAAAEARARSARAELDEIDWTRKNAPASINVYAVADLGARIAKLQSDLDDAEAAAKAARQALAEAERPFKKCS